MLLSIDTSQPNLIKLCLYKDKDEKSIHQMPTDKGQLEDLLPAIDRFLEENNVSLQDLTALATNPGPGAYTGLRIGVTTANILAWSLDLPIYHFENELSTVDLHKILQTKQKFSKFVSPKYSNTLS